MSKSKGNVVNPLELIDQYGADAVRFALVYGNATGNDQALSYPKLDASRKFTNKLWNMGRFLLMQLENKEVKYMNMGEFALKGTPSKKLTWSFSVMDDTNKLAEEITHYLDKYQFNLAAERLYEYAWHKFADIDIEIGKSFLNEEDEDNAYVRGALLFSYEKIIKLLHPFMPFVTEEIYQKLPGAGESLMIARWPISAELATS